MDDFMAALKTMPHVRLYTRRGCHLCEQATQEIRNAGRTGEYTFEEIDVDFDAALVMRYGMDIPVVTINGIVVFKHQLTAEGFKHQLRNFFRVESSQNELR